MLVSNIEIFLRKKKKRSITMIVNDRRTFQRMSIKVFFKNARNKDYLSIKYFFLYLPQVDPQSIKKNLGKYKKFVQGGFFKKKYKNFFWGVFLLFFFIFKFGLEIAPGYCIFLYFKEGINLHKKLHELRKGVNSETFKNVIVVN